METTPKSGTINISNHAGSRDHSNTSSEYSLNITHLSYVNSTSLGNVTSNISSWISNQLSKEDIDTNVNYTKTLHLLLTEANSTFLNSVQSNTSTPLLPISGIMPNATDSYFPLTSSTQHSRTTAIPQTEMTGLNSMEKWFIATGSIIIAVIILFLLNICIQYRALFQKFFLRFRRRNEMVDAEKRCHRDRELLGGGAHSDDSKTQTHIFLNKIMNKHDTLF